MENFIKLEEYEPKKDREVKVSLSDLYFLFSGIYNQAAAHPEEIPEGDYEKVNTLFNRYLVSAQLRDEEAKWFDVMKKVDAGEYKDMKAEEQQNYKRTAYEYYLEAKSKREQLQKELEL